MRGLARGTGLGRKKALKVAKRGVQSNGCFRPEADFAITESNAFLDKSYALFPKA